MEKLKYVIKNRYCQTLCPHAIEMNRSAVRIGSSFCFKECKFFFKIDKKKSFVWCYGESYFTIDGEKYNRNELT